MTVTILFFGIARDIAACRSLLLEVAEPVNAGYIRTMLSKQYPSLAGLRSFAIAVNNEYASDERQLNHGDEVAILPPVSGG